MLLNYTLCGEHTVCWRTACCIRSDGLCVKKNWLCVKMNRNMQTNVSNNQFKAFITELGQNDNILNGILFT